MAPRNGNVTILLCTRNGDRFLTDQLDSLLQQDHRDWSLWVSDDGSTDATRHILEEFRARHGTTRDIRIVNGPGRGAAANYLSLLCRPDLPEGPVALCDQDDIWLPHKLSRALSGLDARGDAGADRPRIYGGQWLYVRDDLSPIGAANRPQMAPSFAHALIENAISGHTCVMNAAAVALTRAAGADRDVPFHDWWLYQLVTGAGGEAIVDDEIVLLYRQHGANLLGGAWGARAASRRISLLFGRTYQGWLKANTGALLAEINRLSPENRDLVLRFAAILADRSATRTLQLYRLGLRRNSRMGTAGFYLAAALGRV